MASVSPGRAPRISLPVAPPRKGRTGGCGPPRKSTRGKWRALSLTLVHVGFAAHLLHWRLAGRTLTPLEPSESMYTLEQGLVNAGCVFFALAILATLILGRWVCGWGCHLLALQDLCTWLLKKAGVRIKPFRSRLLVFVPLLAALYMFVWPTVQRTWRGQPPPAFVAHFLTYDFWATFPSAALSVLTLVVCGVFIVCLLGNKGYCTYACPYGGFFALADRVAPGKIRVTDDCDQCGHCTAACTSNVRVHEEVKLYRMVVNPGCMKCTDCVSVCPKNALYFGFGRPALLAGPPAAPRRPRTHEYTWGEELALAAVFLLSLYAFRGLYHAVPFLFSLGLASICAYLFLQAARAFYLPSVQVHRLQVRFKGRLTAGGAAFLGAMLLLGAFVGHSVVLQFHQREADRLLAQSRRLQETAASSDVVAQTSRRALAHLRWAQRWGLFPVAKTEAQLGALHLFLEQPEAAERHLRRALELSPHYGEARARWAELQARRGDLEAAARELHRAIRDNPALPEIRGDLIAAARRLGRLPEAAAALEFVVQRRPYDVAARLDLALVLAESHQLARGLEQVRQVVRERPEVAQAHFLLGLMLAESGEHAAALETLTRAVRLDPDSARRRFVLAQLAARLERADVALVQFEQARRLAPFDPEILRAWAAYLAQSGELSAALEAARRAAGDEPAAQYALVFLYLAAGDVEQAQSLLMQVRRVHPGAAEP